MEPGDLESKALALVSEANAITITNVQSYEAAWDFLKRLKSAQKAWEDHNAPVVSSAHTAWKQAVAARDKLLKPFGEAERCVKLLISAYQQEQDRLRIERERKANDDAQLAAAEQAQAQGNHDEAEALLNGNGHIPPVIERPATPKIAGGSIRENWKGRVVDLKLLAAAVATGRAPITLIQVDQSALDQLAKATKQSFNVPGCQAYSEAVVSART